MPLWTKIYAILWERHQVPFPGKKSKAQKNKKNDVILRSGFFSENTLGYGPAIRIFLQDLPTRIGGTDLRRQIWDGVKFWVGSYLETQLT